MSQSHASVNVPLSSTQCARHRMQLAWQSERLFGYGSEQNLCEVSQIAPGLAETLKVQDAVVQSSARHDAAGRVVARVSLPDSARWHYRYDVFISHHVGYSPQTNEMTMQFVNPEYHSYPHVGGAHEFETDTGFK
ncbi:hypothetical protein PB20LOC_018590 [Pectobacterium parmentieri]|nr:hypothetical protein [Pectobacterium parmentieri]QPK19394.1 hypothetical protein PB20LOC_018590 [Pectobacterium parmentieri]